MVAARCGSTHAVELLLADAQEKGPSKAELDRLYSKCTRSLLPIFFLMITLSYIDRTNLAFASIQLNEDLGFSPEVYGLGSGLFFLGYAALQVAGAPACCCRRRRRHPPPPPAPGQAARASADTAAAPAPCRCPATWCS
jgi:hypothetical protein